MMALLGGGLIAGSDQQIASRPMHLGFVVPLASCLDDLRSLYEAIEALDRLPEPGVGLGKTRKHPWRQ